MTPSQHLHYSTAVGPISGYRATNTLIIFITAINIASDILFATLPAPIIWSLQVNRKTKVTLVVILSLGYLLVEGLHISLDVS